MRPETISLCSNGQASAQAAPRRASFNPLKTCHQCRLRNLVSVSEYGHMDEFTSFVSSAVEFQKYYGMLSVTNALYLFWTKMDKLSYSLFVTTIVTASCGTYALISYFLIHILCGGQLYIVTNRRHVTFRVLQGLLSCIAMIVYGIFTIIAVKEMTRIFETQDKTLVMLSCISMTSVLAGVSMHLVDVVRILRMYRTARMHELDKLGPNQNKKDDD